MSWINISVTPDKGLEQYRSLCLSGVASMALFLTLLAIGCSSSVEVKQPIAFNHKVHVSGEKMLCTDCHQGAETADHATIPGKQICADCHEEAIGESQAEAALVMLLSSDTPVPWVRVHKLAEHVRFSHRRHVAAGKILCETCHGDVPQREQPFSRPFINFKKEPGMDRCIRCHRKSGHPRASIDCALCHR